MTKERFLNDFEETFHARGIEIKGGKEGSMNNPEDIAGCNFPGIYVIIRNNEVIYIGSAYAGTRSIADRLTQYLGNSRTGNTLANAFMRHENTEFAAAVEKIRKCDFMAFEYRDLEYELISKCDNLINCSGNVR